MKFIDIVRTAGNIFGMLTTGRPMFAEPTTPVPLPNNTSTKIMAGIALVEKMTTEIPSLQNLTGAEKLAMASRFTAEAINASTALTNTEVEDKDRYALGISKITDGWNDVAKSLKRK